MDEYASRQYPVREHMVFQGRTWIVQRIGWLVLAGIAIAALLGLFGGGVLSNRTAANAAMTVEYEHFQRVTRLVRFEFRLAPAATAERTLHLGRSFQENYEISSIAPQPSHSVAARDGLDLTFATSNAAASRITIWARPRAYGRLSIDARTDGGAPVTFNVLVYP